MGESHRARVDSVLEIEAAKRRLEAAGVEVLGVTDHHIIQSIYFFDPNGMRVELTARSVPQSYMDAAEQKRTRRSTPGRPKSAAENRRAA